MTLRVNGIILKKNDYRESDRFFVIYTDKLGKIEAVAKGVKKIQSKMAGHLDLFSIIDILVAPGKIHYQIAGVDTFKNFLNLKADFGKIVLGSYVLELVNNFVKLEHPDLNVYKLLEDLLKIFNDQKNKNFLKLYGLSKFFVLKLLTFLGWGPELYNCVKCKKKILPNGNLFDVKHGGLICNTCGHEGFLISTATIKILRFVLKSNLKSLLALEIDTKHFKEAIKIIDSFLAVYQDQELKSAVWINRLTQLLEVC